MASKPIKGSRITPEEIKEMAILYDQLGTYAAVAWKMGRSADTVSKYMKKLKRHDSMSVALAGRIRENKESNRLLVELEFSDRRFHHTNKPLKER